MFGENNYVMLSKRMKNNKIMIWRFLFVLVITFLTLFNALCYITQPEISRFSFASWYERYNKGLFYDTFNYFKCFHFV